MSGWTIAVAVFGAFAAGWFMGMTCMALLSMSADAERAAWRR